MISADDIEAFHGKSSAAIDAAAEYKRRARKGLPEDRYTTTAGALLVAKGIHARDTILAALNAVVLVQDQHIKELEEQCQAIIQLAQKAQGIHDEIRNLNSRDDGGTS